MALDKQIKTNGKFFEAAAFALLVLAAVTLSLNPLFGESVTYGISLWAACLLPSLLPYVFITEILSALKTTEKLTNKLSPLTSFAFNVGGASGYAFFISILSGYPMGAKTVSDLKLNGAITETEAIRASILCSTSSPSFLVGTVGGIMLGNVKFGLALFSVHLITALIVGIICSFYKRKEKPATDVRTSKKLPSLYDAVNSSVMSALTVGGLIALFSVLTDMLIYFKLLTPVCEASRFIFGNSELGDGVVLGLIESTRGLKKITSVGITELTLPVCAGICGFGGLSVIAQSTAFLKKAKIKTAPFFFSKLLSSVLNFCSGCVVSAIFF